MRGGAIHPAKLFEESEGMNKKEIIKQIASNLRIPLNSIALIGDSAADLPIKKCLRITYKPYHWTARQAANIVVEDDDLQAILPHLIPEQQKNSQIKTASS